MSLPLPAVQAFSPSRSDPAGWSFTYKLCNEDRSPIDGDGCEALVQFWDQPRLVLMAVAKVEWISLKPAVIVVSLDQAQVHALGVVAYGDLLVINCRGLRQYLVEITLTPVA